MNKFHVLLIYCLLSKTITIFIPYLSDNWSFLAWNNNRIANFKLAIDQANVNGGAETRNLLDLHNRALKLLRIGDSFGQNGLSDVDDETHQVADTVACHRRCWYHRDVSFDVWIAVVESCVKTLFNSQ
jgi:hypothetical protein